MQYTAVAKNLIGLKPARIANLMVTGMWSNQNCTEHSKFGNANVVANSWKDNDCTKMVDSAKWNIDPKGSYFYFCTNETVHGFEFNLETFPWHLIPKGMPVVADMSSNIGTCDIPWDKLDMVLAGAQKNLGPSGCTIMCIKDSLIGHADKDVPVLCDWDLHEKSPDTYYNTPCVWSMYVTGLNCSYMN